MQTWQSVTKILNKGGVAIIPTDTLYGVVGSALESKTVERIYKIRGRDENKPCIILITKYSDLEKFGILDHTQFGRSSKLSMIWPGKVSVILPVNKKFQSKFKYLHRGTKTLSFRMIGPRNRNLFNLIQHVGPLVAPSANPQGLSPALNIWQARKYFGASIDAYMCGGTRNSKPSTLVSYKDGIFTVLRQGAVVVK